MIPGHGRVSEETDVAEFRDMVVINPRSRARICCKEDDARADQGGQPSRDYDSEYGASAADADRFVESIYRSLTTAKPAGGKS